MQQASSSERVWYLSRGDQQWGPLSEQEFAHLMGMVQLRPTDYVWNQSMDAWKLASDVPGLIRAPSPPPPPRPAQPPQQASAPRPAEALHAFQTPQAHQHSTEPASHDRGGAVFAGGAAGVPVPGSPGTSTEPVSTTLAMASYIMGFLGFIPILPLVGFIIALVNLNAKPDWLATHYRWQVRTVLIGLLWGLIGLATSFIGIGVIVLLVGIVWFIVRYVKGISALSRNEPVENVARWGF